MRLVVDKLGRIEHAEIEIRPLTVLVGESNTNKTWVAYCLYGLMRYLTWRESSQLAERFGYGNLPISPPSAGEAIDEAIRAVIPTQKGGVLEFAIRRRDLIAGVHEPVVFSLGDDRIRELLRLTEDLVSGSSASLEVSPEEFQLRDASVQVTVNYDSRSVQIGYETSRGEARSFRRQAAARDPDDVLNDSVSKYLRSFACRFMGPGNTYALPAERKALMSTYKLLRPEFEQTLNRPVVEFAEFLTQTENLWAVRQDPQIPEAITYLEASILGGAVKLQSAGPGLRMVFAPEDGPALPLHSSASMVRSLAGLDLYLRCWAAPGDLLFIDEPEMNAHPEAQVYLAELLAYLVNRGIRIVLTTHSPYIVDHLNNLIRAKDLLDADQVDVAKHFKLETAACFLDASKVSAYLFAEESRRSAVQVSPIFSTKRHMIDWETFGRTSDYVNNLYSAEIVPRLYRD